MSITKADLFDKKQKQKAEIAKALSHPARIAILELLAERETCICGDITEELPLAQSTISQHLKALKKAAVIKGIVDGPSVCYCLNENTIEKFENLFLAFIQNLKTPNQLKYCCYENKD